MYDAIKLDNHQYRWDIKTSQTKKQEHAINSKN